MNAKTLNFDNYVDMNTRTIFYKMVLSMERWKGKVAVVTGAGGGIGSAVVEKLLDKGLQVVAVDICPEFLETLSKKLENKKTNLHTFKIDINEEEEVVELFKTITKTLGVAHILINCAGIVQKTNLTDGDVKKWRKLLDVNVVGLSIMTREAVRRMKANKINGHIVNFCSVAGHYVPNLPDLNMYPASKFAVKALSETLRQEFNHLGLKIKITNLSPGLVDTLLLENNDFDPGKQAATDIDNSPKLQPADIADGVVFALSTPPHVQVHELTIKPVGEPH